MYCGGTIFVDVASGTVHVYHQVSLAAADTLLSKAQFKHEADLTDPENIGTFLKTRWDTDDRDHALEHWDPEIDGEMPPLGPEWDTHPIDGQDLPVNPDLRGPHSLPPRVDTDTDFPVDSPHPPSAPHNRPHLFDDDDNEVPQDYIIEVIKEPPPPILRSPQQGEQRSGRPKRVTKQPDRLTLEHASGITANHQHATVTAI
jgi:hypothetical protein